MPTYDIPRTEIYQQPASAFGATTESMRWFTPRGMYGFVRDIDINITADMVGTTTVPEIAVGTAQGNNEYARFRLGTAAGTGFTSAQGGRRASQVSGGLNTFEPFTGAVLLSRARIPTNAEFFISRVAGTGGTPAGNGTSRVIIDWF